MLFNFVGGLDQSGFPASDDYSQPHPQRFVVFKLLTPGKPTRSETELSDILNIGRKRSFWETPAETRGTNLAKDLVESSSISEETP